MNSKTIESKVIDTTFRAFWSTWVTKINDCENKKEWWEITKVKIKEICIEVGKQLSKERNIQIRKSFRDNKTQNSI